MALTTADIEEQITMDNITDLPETDSRSIDTGITNDGSFPKLKQGINLPKNDSGWLTAKEYFKCMLQLYDPIRLPDVNSKIKLLNDVIYNYFADDFGHNETVPNECMVGKYKECTMKELKKAL